MVAFPALHDPGIVEKLFNLIKSKEPPGKVDAKYLEKEGFRRGTDAKLLELLEFLGYVDDKGKPTEIWKRSRDRNRAPGLLGSAVMTGYWKLFEKIPAAATATDGASLMSFFKEETDASDQEAAYMILTFKVLCDLSDFDAAVDEPLKPAKPEAEEGQEEEKKEEKKEPEEATPDKEAADVLKRAMSLQGGAPIKLALQIEVDPGSEPELYGLLVKLLRKQLEG
ncbi:hypothetical protein GF402_00250 [Candidatus Fermentibacteria bacterium]|nr:hypothetical protein [Candidatus Fermentibacteria bacterium]